MDSPYSVAFAEKEGFPVNRKRPEPPVGSAKSTPKKPKPTSELKRKPLKRKMAEAETD